MIFDIEERHVASPTVNRTTKIYNRDYSSLPNSRGAWNKRGGRKDGSFLISVVPGISVVVGILTSYIFKSFCLDGQHVYKI